MQCRLGRPRVGGWQHEGLANARERDPRRGQRPPEPLNRFIHRLPTEAECLMMDRDDKTGARLIGHLDGLLGCAVTGNPGVVGADRYHHDIVRPRANRGEARSRRVTGDTDTTSVAFEHVAIEPAMDIGSHPRAPVLHPERVDGQMAMRTVDLFRIAPAHFDHVAKPHRHQQVRGRRRRDHRDVAP